ncbi:hypothetical protein BKA70DRAFT_1262321, partial [Coprinopsis sp. MPI-PUGE-AT-0042]
MMMSGNIGPSFNKYPPSPFFLLLFFLADDILVVTSLDRHLPPLSPYLSTSLRPFLLLITTIDFISFAIHPYLNYPKYHI